jgi:hypothetical protein
MTDRDLMLAIKNVWGAAISAVAAGTQIPASFFAALIANESAGDPNAKRFEKNVLAALWEVLLGRTPAYGSIRTADLVKFVAGLSAIPPSAPQSIPADAFQRLDDLATSQGLTQIMGYEAIPFATTIDALKAPATELPITAKMLADFAARFTFDPATDFSDLFDCWNTGRPHRPTYDPKYIPNGLARMKLYESL